MKTKLPIKSGPFKWSPSALKTFETCPRMYWYRYWNPDGVKEEPGEAAVWGLDVHKAFEDCVKSGNPKLPERYKQYQKFLDFVFAMKGEKTAERKVAYNRFWEPVDFKSPEAWVRFITDLRVKNDSEGYIIDYKTGKSRYVDNSQLQICSIELLQDPEIETIKTCYMFFKENKISPVQVWDRERVESFKPHFEEKVRPLAESHATGFFEQKPCGLCKQWCGDLSCEYNGKR